MAHKHSVYDTDPHFSINPITRAIKNESGGKVTLIQGDHNSERFSFDMPRMIEDHDMLQCDKVKVHYINTGKTGTTEDVYDVDDFQISPDGDDTVVFSWLISGNATKHAGPLQFAIEFQCTTNGSVDYAWHTAVFAGISVSTGMNNGAAIAEDYSDIIEQWRAKLISARGIDDTMSSSTTTYSSQKIDADMDLLKTGIKRVESLDTETPGGLVNLRDLETGLYVLYGYFSPYANSDMSMTFDNTMVVVSKRAAGSHFLVLTGLNSKVNFLEILVDESQPGGHTYTRTDFVMLDMHHLIAQVGSLESLTTEDKSSIVAAINEIIGRESQLKDTTSDLEDILGVTFKNLVDTMMMASVITDANGAVKSGFTIDAENGRLVSTVTLLNGRRLFSGQKIPVTEGEVYTISGYVRWEDTSSDRKVVIGIENQFGQQTIAAADAADWVRVQRTVTINAETAAYGEARILFQAGNTSESASMYVKDIQVERGATMTEYVPYGTYKESARLKEHEDRLNTIETDTNSLNGAEKFFFYIANNKTPIIETVSNGGLIVTLPDFFCCAHNGEILYIHQTELVESLGSVAEAYGNDGVRITMAYQSALVFDQANQKVEYKKLAGLKDGEILLLCNGWENPYGPMMQYALRSKVELLESAATNVEDKYAWEPAAQEYAALFNGTNNVESFLFFTDPHIAEARPIEDRFKEYTEFVAKVYDSTPTTFCVCGGDWIGNGDTQAEACYKLGRIDAHMRSLIPEYVPIVGNHDTNYQGKLDADSANYTGTLTDATIRNLWFRREGAAYYRYAGATSAMYVLDSGTDSTAASMSDYRWAQIDWLAKSLKQETAENVILAMHIIYNNETLAALADNVLAVAEAYNARTSITLNGTAYDFSGCAGKVRFAIAGHTHADSNGTLHGIPYVISTKLEDGSVPTFDLVLADWDTGAAHFIRVGSGESRSVTMA